MAELNDLDGSLETIKTLVIKATVACLLDAFLEVDTVRLLEFVALEPRAKLTNVRALEWLPLILMEPPVKGHCVRLAMSVVSLTLAPGNVVSEGMGIGERVSKDAQG
jgi:hypothetical protein